MERRVRFELLYERWAPAVKAYVLRRADAGWADDVVADVFVVCWRRLEEMPEDPLPWLLAVARRSLSTQRRSERRRTGLQTRLVETASPAQASPPQPATDGALAAALERLSGSDRELLLLIAWDGLSPAQAAAALDLKPSTLRVRLLRARRRLREQLAHSESASSRALQALAEVSR